MKPYKDFIISPVGKRYNNFKKVGYKELILNTEVYNHQFVNRLAKVIATPLLFQSPINVGDEVIVHHNIFRRWHDVKGRERNSRSYFNKNTYLINHDQIFLYKRDKNWICPKGYCFIQPIKETDKFGTEIEKPITGLVKYSDGTVNVGEVIGYRPGTECEFVIDNTKLYRILSNLITIKYEHQANQETYNPSWAQSG